MSKAAASRRPFAIVLLDDAPLTAELRSLASKESWDLIETADPDEVFARVASPRCFCVLTSANFRVPPSLLMPRCREVSDAEWICLVGKKTPRKTRDDLVASGASAIEDDSTAPVTLLHRMRQMFCRTSIRRLGPDDVCPPMAFHAGEPFALLALDARATANAVTESLVGAGLGVVNLDSPQKASHWMSLDTFECGFISSRYLNDPTSPVHAAIKRSNSSKRVVVCGTRVDLKNSENFDVLVEPAEPREFVVRALRLLGRTGQDVGKSNEVLSLQLPLPDEKLQEAIAASAEELSKSQSFLERQEQVESLFLKLIGKASGNRWLLLAIKDGEFLTVASSDSKVSRNAKPLPKEQITELANIRLHGGVTLAPPTSKLFHEISRLFPLSPHPQMGCIVSSIPSDQRLAQLLLVSQHEKALQKSSEETQSTLSAFAVLEQQSAKLLHLHFFGWLYAKM